MTTTIIKEVHSNFVNYYFDNLFKQKKNNLYCSIDNLDGFRLFGCCGIIATFATFQEAEASAINEINEYLNGIYQTTVQIVFKVRNK